MLPFFHFTKKDWHLYCIRIEGTIRFMAKYGADEFVVCFAEVVNAPDTAFTLLESLNDGADTYLIDSWFNDIVYTLEVSESLEYTGKLQRVIEHPHAEEEGVSDFWELVDMDAHTLHCDVCNVDIDVPKHQDTTPELVWYTGKLNSRE